MKITQQLSKYWNRRFLPVLGTGVILMSLTGAYSHQVQAQENPGLLTSQKEVEAVKALFELQQKKINAFKAHLESNANVGAEAREKAMKMVVKRSLDTDDRKQTIMDGLAKVYPMFDEGLDYFDDDELEDAAASFKKMAGAHDQWLSVNAQFMLARAYVADEEFEKALPILEEIAGGEGKLLEYTLHDDEAMFMLAVAQQKNLKYKDAITSLEKFIEKHGYTAPERMVVGAATTLILLRQMKPGSLEDVHAHMEWSRNRLDQEDTGESTQQKHEKIVKMLEVLIEEAEKKEQQGQGQGQDQGQGQQQQQQGGPANGENPSNPAEDSNLPGGEAGEENLKRKITGKDGEQWGQQRQKEREKVMNSIQNKMPERYRKLTEEYYKSLREGKRRSAKNDE